MKYAALSASLLPHEHLPWCSTFAPWHDQVLCDCCQTERTAAAECITALVTLLTTLQRELNSAHGISEESATALDLALSEEP
jgi:hypothetical protein